MPHQQSRHIADNDITDQHLGWPNDSNRATRVGCSVELQLSERTVELVRILACGNDMAFPTSAWSRTYDSASDADDAFAALSSRQSDLVHWSVGAIALGSSWLDTTIDPLVAEFVEEREEERERVAKELEKERVRLEKERTAATRISGYFRERKGRYLLELERGCIKAKPILSIAFKEAWERDRLWDWLFWQKERFQEFAEFMQDGCALELERRLLREMLVTEQAVKKQGLGSGGRRPLRFWRGELWCSS